MIFLQKFTLHRLRFTLSLRYGCFYNFAIVSANAFAAAVFFSWRQTSMTSYSNKAFFFVKYELYQFMIANTKHHTKNPSGNLWKKYLGCASNKLQQASFIFLAKSLDYLPEPLDNWRCRTVTRVLCIYPHVLHCYTSNTISFVKK